MITDSDSEKIHEECGVFGVFANESTDVASTVYYGLFALQHRGQEGCGIVVNDDGLFNSYKDLGIVNDVFTADVLKGLGYGNMAVGHVRYGTTGGNGRSNTQPIVVNHIKGRMALAHNGNLVNSFELREKLELEGSIFHTTSDTEVISYMITKERIKCPSIEEAVNRAMHKIDGAYSLVVMSPSKLIAARDPHGFRPLCYGKTEDGRYIVASESCALDAVGAEFIRDVKPGEIIVFDKNGIRTIEEHCGTAANSMCVFEYIYFARPDSVIEGCNVHKARVRAGELLAKAYPADADIVIGVPDSGLDAAIGYSRESGIPYGIGFIKNKYIGRTFISPGQASREDKVKIKLNPIAEVVKGKRVVMIDDSIVRGTTSQRIVKLVRDAGAREVHVRISAPPFTNPCYYGTDIDSKENLIACKHTIEEIAEIIGADSLGYLKTEDVSRLAEGSACTGYCSACFDGKYPTQIPKKNAKNRFEQKISENGKKE
ncbi:MAG: amidophosphoribosyltransferase [Lachnospiraceae bacterium]|nr:amidophosphoribosyltransferase [Lachnospiraceae bacterium]